MAHKPQPNDRRTRFRKPAKARKRTRRPPNGPAPAGDGPPLSEGGTTQPPEKDA